jgi:hypothetical protein
VTRSVNSNRSKNRANRVFSVCKKVKSGKAKNDFQLCTKKKPTTLCKGQKKSMSANQLSLAMLRNFAPANSPVLAYRVESTGNPMHDWAQHIGRNSLFRRELEENSVIENVVVRAAEGDEAPAIERVKILSLAYAMRFFGNAEDAKEFVRCVRAIAAPEAAQFELEQTASHYYGECRRQLQNKQPVSPILKEMAMLGMEMTRVTALIADLEIESSETEISAPPIRLSEAEIKQANALVPLPVPTPIFDAEMTMIRRKLSRNSITKAARNEFEDYYLTQDCKTIEEWDENVASFAAYEQFDENGLIGFSMNSNQRIEIVCELNGEINAEYLPETVRPLVGQLQRIFVGHKIGGRSAQTARYFTASVKIETGDIARARTAFRLNQEFVETPKPDAADFPLTPLTRDEINEWIDLQLDLLYSREVRRTARRFTTVKGKILEFAAVQFVNPDFEEKQYASQILHILLEQMQKDFHLTALRRNEVYQTIFLAIRGTTDTAALAQTGATARTAKDERRLSLKEYTALVTAAKTQFARLSNARPSMPLYKLLREINRADVRKIGYLKWAMYGQNQPAHPVHSLPKQEVAAAWNALKARDTLLKQESEAKAAVNVNATRFSQTQIRPAASVRQQITVVRSE